MISAPPAPHARQVRPHLAGADVRSAHRTCIHRPQRMPAAAYNAGGHALRRPEKGHTQHPCQQQPHAREKRTPPVAVIKRARGKKRPTRPSALLRSRSDPPPSSIKRLRRKVSRSGGDLLAGRRLRGASTLPALLGGIAACVFRCASPRVWVRAYRLVIDWGEAPLADKSRCFDGRAGRDAGGADGKGEDGAMRDGREDAGRGAETVATAPAEDRTEAVRRTGLGYRLPAGFSRTTGAGGRGRGPSDQMIVEGGCIS